ncbi:MAG TPA: ferrochelatase, partial [Thermoanaerobaculia bacterium]|nr:ferrochelatase [Thermoanaerobaculia bacterium]
MAIATFGSPVPSQRERVGLLLVNVGTPDAPRPREVRRYLREFLSDPRVLDFPAWRRTLLVELLILPRRARASAAAYRKIWTAEGSPLLVHGRALAGKLQARLGEAVQVELAMRYGNPSIESALERLERAGVGRIVLLPLYPHYSSAATGSAIARVLEAAAARWNTPYLQVIEPFYDHPAYVDARAESV